MSSLSTALPFRVEQTAFTGYADLYAIAAHQMVREGISNIGFGTFLNTADKGSVFTAQGTRDNELVGVGIVSLNNEYAINDPDKTAYLHYLVSHPDLRTNGSVRGFGIGKTVLQAIETYAVRQGDTFMELLALEREPVGFYERQGYRIIDQGDESEQTFYYMQKNLV